MSINSTRFHLLALLKIPWPDNSLLPDSEHLLLRWPHRLSCLDLGESEVSLFAFNAVIT